MPKKTKSGINPIKILFKLNMEDKQMRAFRTTIIGTMSALLMTVPVFAQALTEQQLKNKFEKHRGLVPAPKDTKAPPAKGATVTSTQSQAAKQQEGYQTQSASNPSNARNKDRETPVQTVKTTVEPSVPAYVPIKQDAAVNIQILFDYDSAVLRVDQRPKLSKLCNVIQEMQSDLFQVVGHTDAAGTASYNQRLSRLRAEEVARYMTSTCGIGADRLRTLGVGEEHLIDKQNPLSGRNRRVEFQLLS